MKTMSVLKSVTLHVAATVIAIASQESSAHTTFRNGSAGVENVTDYDFVQTSHGCFANSDPAKTARTPVTATSVVFPTDADAIVETFPSSAATPTGTKNAGTPAHLSDFFSWTDHTGAVSALTNISSLITWIQSAEVFPKARRKVDSLGNTVGFEVYGGKLDPFSTGAYPVKIGGVKFSPTSCAAKVVIRVAIADVCKRNVFPPKAGSANVWINHTTAKFIHSDLDGIAPVDNTGAAVPANFWPAITIKRNLTSNPLPANCNAGNTVDVFVTPSDAQIDMDLPIKGYWGK